MSKTTLIKLSLILVLSPSFAHAITIQEEDLVRSAVLSRDMAHGEIFRKQAVAVWVATLPDGCNTASIIWRNDDGKKTRQENYMECNNSVRLHSVGPISFPVEPDSVRVVSSVMRNAALRGRSTNNWAGYQVSAVRVGYGSNNCPVVDLKITWDNQLVEFYTKMVCD